MKGEPNTTQKETAEEFRFYPVINTKSPNLFISSINRIPAKMPLSIAMNNANTYKKGFNLHHKIKN